MIRPMPRDYLMSVRAADSLVEGKSRDRSRAWQSGHIISRPDYRSVIKSIAVYIQASDELFD